MQFEIEFFFLRIRRPQRATRTDTLLPNTTLFRSRGAAVFTMPGGRKVLVVQVMGRIFMDPLDDPFAAVDGELQKYRLGSGSVDAVIVDIHGEAPPEKMAMGHFCDGRASLVCGTHRSEERRVGKECVSKCRYRG